MGSSGSHPSSDESVGYGGSSSDDSMGNGGHSGSVELGGLTGGASVGKSGISQSHVVLVGFSVVGNGVVVAGASVQLTKLARLHDRVTVSKYNPGEHSNIVRSP